MIADRWPRVGTFVTTWGGALVPLLVVLPLTLSYGTYALIPGGLGGATAQKALVVVAIGVAGLLLGFRLPPLPVWILGCAVALAYVVGLVTQARGVEGFDSEMLFGAAGLTYAWLVFFVDWRKIAPVHRALALTAVAPLTIVIATVLNLSGLISLTIVRAEYTGAMRLSAGLPSAFLAGLALMGVIAAAWMWTYGAWWGFYLAILNAGILALTGTRVATLAGAVVFIGVVVVAVVRRLRHWLPALVITVVTAVAGSILVLPNFVKRAAGAANEQGLFDGSGRDQAWTYFVRRLSERPWTGFGPGSGPLLASESSNHVIRDHFVSPHNTYLTYALDLGTVLATVFFASLVWLLVVVARRSTGAERWVFIAASIACLAYATFDNLLTAAQSAVTFALFIAFVWSGPSTERYRVIEVAAALGERSPRRTWRMHLRSDSR